MIIGGAALPAVRVELNPTALFKYGIGLEDVRAALASANANSPKGAIEADGLHYQLYTNDQASHAADYQPLVVAYRNGAAVRLSDVADVQDSVENLRNAGLSQRQARGAGHPVPPARRQHHRHRRQREGGDPATDGGDAARHGPADRQRPHHDDPRQPARHRDDAADRGRAW